MLMKTFEAASNQKTRGSSGGTKTRLRDAVKVYNQTFNDIQEFLQFQHQQLHHLQSAANGCNELTNNRSTDRQLQQRPQHKQLADYEDYGNNNKCSSVGSSSATTTRGNDSIRRHSVNSSKFHTIDKQQSLSSSASARNQLLGGSVTRKPNVSYLDNDHAIPEPRAFLASSKSLDSDNGRIIQQDTADAMVGLVRLVLVILISVLLVKLRAPKTNGRADGSTELRSRRRRSSSSASSTNEDIISTSYRRTNTRETRISSESKRTNQSIGISNISSSSSSSSSSISNSDVQQFRRHSQPNLISNTNTYSQSSMAASERRRRHSDTTAAAALASLSLPPGPMGLPFLGYLPFLGNEIHLTLTELGNKFGPIYQIFLGSIRVVVLNDAALVRQAFKQTVFSGRPDTQLTRILQGYGIVNSDGALWKEQRAFLHTALRKLGAKSLMSGSNGLEAKIQNQVKEFVSDLRVHASEGKPCQVRPIVARAVSSVVGSIVMNLTYRKYEEKEKFDRLIELMQEGFRLFSIAMPLDFIPIFRFLPGVSYAYKKMKWNRAETSAFFQDVADEHRKYLSKTFNLGVPNSTGSLHPRTSQQPPTTTPTPTPTPTPTQLQPQQLASTAPVNLSHSQTLAHMCGSHGASSKPSSSLLSSPPPPPSKPVELDNIVARDLVDAYLVQQKKHEKDGKENYFSDQQLVQIMSDIFSAGLETVTSTIEWSILFLILNPECQLKIQDEIDRIVGRDRLPQLEDLAQMPYTEATIYEVLRRSNVVALGNAHATLADATIAGYRIPKGTQVLPNLYGIHMSPKLWHEPQRFDPSRFIVNERAQKPDYFIPFSVGRRMCLGDVLAKMEVFLFLVGLLQKYDLSVHEDDRECPPQVKGTIGVSNAPVSFRVALSNRKQQDKNSSSS